MNFSLDIGDEIFGTLWVVLRRIKMSEKTQSIDNLEPHLGSRHIHELCKVGMILHDS